jgi:hypothetical protein
MNALFDPWFEFSAAKLAMLVTLQRNLHARLIDRLRGRAGETMQKLYCRIAHVKTLRRSPAG